MEVILKDKKLELENKEQQATETLNLMLLEQQKAQTSKDESLKLTI
jgi:hypothetical protein